MTNLTVISMGAVDDTVGFYYSGGTGESSHVYNSHCTYCMFSHISLTEGLTATAELAPMCVKSGRK